MGAVDEDLSDTQKMQVRHAALLAVQIEELQTKLANGQPMGSKPMANLIKLQNSLARQLWQLGLGKRRRKTLVAQDPIEAARRLQAEHA
jgi:hypothetical protein